MSTTSTDTDQCRALIGDGERCSRPAQDDGFCYQHDGSDPTVDEAGDDDSEQAQDDGSGEGADEDSASDSAVDTDGSIDRESDSESEQSADESDSDESASGGASSGQGSSLQDVRNSAEVIGRDLIGYEPEGVIGITRMDDGWQVTLEVVERSAVPDTQDILGRYEIDLDSDYDPAGYRRLGRYRRGDTERGEFLE